MVKCSSVLLCILFVTLATTHAYSSIVSHDERAITIDGQRRIFISGSIHYPRSTPEMWPSLIKKAKEGGLNTIDTYVFWNAHEPARRQYDFSGNNDLVRYIKMIQAEGLYAALRIGPYTCAEWNFGGFPVWLHNMPNVVFRTANTAFMNEMQNFTTLIVDMLKKEKLFASQGGPIIVAQIENEYDYVSSAYGAAGRAYIEWCASMANSLDTGVPWLMCKQTDAPEPMLESCNGDYCDQYEPENPKNPKMWTENWTGLDTLWGTRPAVRPAEDVAYAVARFFQTRGTFQNYYMYHGGTNFGRTAGGPYVTTSYDFDGLLDEYGNRNQPKWGHLKQLHNLLTSMEKRLTYGNITNLDQGNSVTVTIFATAEGSSCFISNTNATDNATISFQGIQYFIPAWSVSVLPDCQKDVYNTAKVNTQTSLMVKKSESETNATKLKWSWRPEIMDQTLHGGKGLLSANRLLEQKRATNDASDYLWYMTRVNLHKHDPIWSRNMTLRIHSNAHVLHAYVNGEYVGSQIAKDGRNKEAGDFFFVYEKNIKLSHGSNRIAILSVTVGLLNFGAFYDQSPDGIGTVEIVAYKGEERVIKDLSSHKWNYKIGLNGFDDKLFSLDSLNATKWSTENIPANRMLTWYKSTFKAPSGSDPVAVDLQGLGKGMAWVNGQSIGRYWPGFRTDEDGCSSEPCDYRGTYDSSKCYYNCGQPSQRWYHVPRSFLNEDGDNTLTIFEEMGGNPSDVSFKTVVVGRICANAYENNTLELSCYGRNISAINFASYGDPSGFCGSFAAGTCKGTKNATDVLRSECVGKERCSIHVSSHVFGSPQCDDTVTVKRLAVEAVC